MLTLFRAIVDRVKGMLLMTAARELEAEVVVRQAERHADLRRLAAQHDVDKLPQVASEIRRQIDAMSDEQPLAGITSLAGELVGVGATPIPEPVASHATPRRLKGRTS